MTAGGSLKDISGLNHVWPVDDTPDSRLLCTRPVGHVVECAFPPSEEEDLTWGDGGTD